MYPCKVEKAMSSRQPEEIPAVFFGLLGLDFDVIT